MRGSSSVRRPDVPLLAVVASLATACGALGTEPGEGSIEISVTAQGGRGGDGGFTLTLDGRDPRLLDAAGRVTYARIPEGSHLVHLFGVAEGCEVRGENPRTVEVVEDGTVSVNFSVVCGPSERGGFDVLVTTRGEPLDDDGYQLSVAGAPLRVIGVNARELYLELAAGVHLITLKDVIPECRVEGGNPQPFSVVAGRTVEVRLAVICGAAAEPR